MPSDNPRRGRLRSPMPIPAERAAELIERALARGRRTVFVSCRHFLLLRLAEARLVRRAPMQPGAAVHAE